MMQSWLVNKRTYSARASVLITELCKLQEEASKEELGATNTRGGQQSHYRRRTQEKALQHLQEGTSSSIVDVVLPAFLTKAGEEIREVHTHMPLNVKPTKAMVSLDANVLKWLFIRATEISEPDKRTYTKGDEKRRKVSARESTCDVGKECGGEDADIEPVLELLCVQAVLLRAMRAVEFLEPGVASD
eukprot:9491990-Pyramimonas_sp.AAC.1